MQMKVSTTAKMVPNFLREMPEQIGEFELQIKPAVDVLCKIDNLSEERTNRKRQKKTKNEKSFMEKEQANSKKIDENIMHKRQQSSNVCYTLNGCSVQNNCPGPVNIKTKSKILLDLKFDQESDEQVKQITLASAISKKLQDQEEKSDISLPKNRQNLLDWSNSSDNGQEELKIVQSQPQQLKQQISIQKKPDVLHNPFIVTQQSLYQQIISGTTVRCLIRRDKKNASNNLQYNVYLQNSLKHILTIRKEGIWQYSFYLRHNKPGPTFAYEKISSMSETVFGNNFTLLKNNSKNSQITISYETNLLGLKGPRKLNIYVPKKDIPCEYLHQSYQDQKWKKDILKCVSKSAKWNEQIKSYVLSFKGRALQSSIKNFVITDEVESEDNYYIIFGKAGPELYNLDISYPFSLIQGVSVAMTSFQRKMSCD